MVMYTVLTSVFTIAGKVATEALISKLAPQDDAPSLAAQEEAMQMEQASRLGRALEAARARKPTPSPVPAPDEASAHVHATSGERYVCPACLLFDQVTLAAGYLRNIARACEMENSGPIPPGEGGTIVQVRAHITAAIGAAHRVGQERPQFAQAGALMARGLSEVLEVLKGEAVGCNAARDAYGFMMQAEPAAAKLTKAWFAKPAQGG